MLNYKFRTNGQYSVSNIEYSELYVEPQGNFISGVTTTDYNLVDYEEIIVETSFLKPVIPTLIDNALTTTYTHSLPIHVENVYRQGFFEINGGKYYIENGEVTINDLTYPLHNQLTTDNTPTLKLLSGEYQAITHYDTNNEPVFDSNKWGYVTKFIVYKTPDEILDINSIGRGDLIATVRYQDTICDVFTDNNGRYFIDETGNVIREIETTNLPLDLYFTISEDNMLEISYEWRETLSSSPYLFLYCDKSNIIEDEQEVIIAENLYNKNVKHYFNQEQDEDKYVEYVVLNGKKYELDSELKKHFIVINNKEYEITNTHNILSKNSDDITFSYKGKSYKYSNINPLLTGEIDINEIKADVVIYTTSEVTFCAKQNDVYDYNGSGYTVNGYDYKSYNYIVVNGQELLIHEDMTDVGVVKYIITEDNETYPLRIISNLGNGTYVCELFYKSNNIQSTAIMKDIVDNIGQYQLRSYNDTFRVGEFIEYDANESEDLKPEIKLYQDHSYLNIPLILDNDIATNLNQYDLIKENFVNSVIDQKINRIIDIEHQTFYPARLISGTDGVEDRFELCDKLIFDLHFRTRNLEDWSIIEDVYQNVNLDDYNNTNEGDDKTNLNTNPLYCNWNIVDHYTNEWNKLGENEELKYYQPSDLLYFLNFDDNDVFYQKDKIGKSFLRLLFYDSIDPMTQSLLASSTIFMDEAALFGKYCNSDKNKTLRPFDVDANHSAYINNVMGVKNEPCKSVSDCTASFNEKLRLSSRMVVSNKYETSTSSEGFYLYIFKDLLNDGLNGLHERTIYMKVQFNHAGVGKTIEMMFPFIVEEDGYPNVTIAKVNDEFKKGYELGNELYQHLYMPIKIRYDKENGKFVYYLPKGMIPQGNIGIKNEKDGYVNAMRFNLYEMKIKDNSGTDDKVKSANSTGTV